MTTGIVFLVAATAAAVELNTPVDIIVVDFQSTSAGRHSCLIAAAFSELHATPEARIIGAGAPSKALMWWGEVAPEVNVGMLRQSAGLYTVEELCKDAPKGDDGSFLFFPSYVIPALRRAYAGMPALAVRWIDGSGVRRVTIQPDAGEPNPDELRKRTIALATPVEAEVMNGCVERRGPAHVLVEAASGRALKQRLEFARGERLCLAEPSSGAARVVIYDEQSNWLGVATVQ